MSTQKDREELRNNPAFRELTDQAAEEYSRSIAHSCEEEMWLSFIKLLEAYSDPEEDDIEIDEKDIDYINLQE